MNTFELLDKKVQKAIWNLGWEQFRPIQDDAIQSIMNNTGDIIISAPTASGKTEAAFLPIISKILNAQGDSVKVLYISPLKALINDQFKRVLELCIEMQFPITKWHGDVNNLEKKKIVKNPDGILLITPESLESLFVNRSAQLFKMFKDLDYVVIDEIHSFVGNERGTQLRSLLKRLEGKIKKSPVKVGLSATINNPHDLATWFNSNSPDSVKIIEDKENSKTIKGIVKVFIRPEVDEAVDSDGLLGESLFELIKKDKNLIFANKKSILEIYCDSMKELARAKGCIDNFYIHHGSLSKEIREETEYLLKKENNISVFCTNTLELGIDIGSITRIVNLAPPYSVSSMIQRLGRSGRKESSAKEFHFYLSEPRITKNSDWGDKLRLNLVQSISIIELMLEKWCEPLKTELFDFSTFVHQILSYLSETGGDTAINIYSKIVVHAFEENFSQSDYIAVLKSLKDKEIIYQNQNDLITLNKKGERITESYEFYAAFKTLQEYRVLNNENEIGRIPAESAIMFEKGSHLLLAGKRWEVLDVKSELKCIIAKKAKDKKPILFNSIGGDIHKKIHYKMFEIFQNQYIPSYLNDRAIELLKECFIHYSLFVQSNETKILLVLEGSKIQRTIATLLRYMNIYFEFIDVGFLAKEGKKYLIEKLKLIDFSTLDINSVLDRVPRAYKMLKKYDNLLSDTLLNKSFAQLALNFEGAEQFCRKL